jgi:DNA-binding winged helix-turn-helix (wHTH) protein/tetratricopeptide (TPR) repeat protein
MAHPWPLDGDCLYKILKNLLKLLKTWGAIVNSSSPPPPRDVRFGEFHLHYSDSSVFKNGERIKLTPKEFETLRVLIENRGNLVTKNALIQRVWPDTFIGDTSLTRNISILRKALGHGVIETVPKLGYRFIAPTEEFSENSLGVTVQSGPKFEGSRPLASTPELRDALARMPQRARFSTWMMAAAALVIAITAMLASIWPPGRDLIAGHLNPPVVFKEIPTASREAWQYYLRGRYFWNKRNPEALEEAFRSFRLAIKVDPKFALAYAGLAQAYAVADLTDPRYHARANTYLEGRAAAEQAIALDPNVSSAHAALAQIFRNFERDMAAAEREYVQAIRLDPNDGTAHQWYAEFLSFNGRHEEAISEIDRAHELEPLSPVIAAVCGTIRINARRYEDAMRFNEEALRLDPHYYAVYGNVASVLEGEGRYGDAIDAISKEAEVAGDLNLARIAREEKAAFAHGGAHSLMRLRMRRVLKNTANQPDGSYDVAAAYCRLRHREPCLQWLEKAVNVRSEGILTVKNNPAFDSVRDDPRYVVLLAKFGF